VLEVGRLIEELRRNDNEKVGSWQLQQKIGLRVPEEIAGRQSCTRVGEGTT
jgi:hypothetical protein